MRREVPKIQKENGKVTPQVLCNDQTRNVSETQTIWCSTRTEKVPNSLSNSRKERFSSSTKKGQPLTGKGIKAEDLKEADDETIQLMKTSST